MMSSNRTTRTKNEIVAAIPVDAIHFETRRLQLICLEAAKVFSHRSQRVKINQLFKNIQPLCLYLDVILSSLLCNIISFTKDSFPNNILLKVNRIKNI